MNKLTMMMIGSRDDVQLVPLSTTGDTWGFTINLGPSGNYRPLVSSMEHSYTSRQEAEDAGMKVINLCRQYVVDFANEARQAALNPTICPHERLDMDGICYACGKDCRGIG